MYIWPHHAGARLFFFSLRYLYIELDYVYIYFFGVSCERVEKKNEISMSPAYKNGMCECGSLYILFIWFTVVFLFCADVCMREREKNTLHDQMILYIFFVR